MVSSRRLRVLCVDDSPYVCDALGALVKQQPDMVCVGALPSADGLGAAVDALQPDVVLLDLTMPGASPLLVLRDVRRTFPAIRVIVMSAYDDRGTVQRAIAHGAWGFISKGADMVELIELIRRAAGGESAVARV